MRTSIILMIVTLFMTSCLSTPDDDKKETIQNDIRHENIVNEKTNSIEYEIVQKKDISFAGESRMVYRVLLEVTSIPSEDEMRTIATEIWENGNKKWDEFTVFMYLPEMDVEWVAYGIGEFRPTGLIDFKINKSALYETKWYQQKDYDQIDTEGNEDMKEYHVIVSVNEEGERELSINIETDFPEGTIFLVSVGRNYYLKGKSELYSGDLYSEDLTVKSGSVYTKLTIDDTKWFSEHQKLVKSLPNDFPPISHISDSITIRVLFSPLRDQTDIVLETLGRHGEYMTGDGVKEYKSFKAYSIEECIYFPIENINQNQTEYASYEALKVGKKYKISRETSLMPELNPKDPIKAINNMKEMEVGSIITILSIETKNNYPWYEVNAVDKEGHNYGRGWVNSIALIGQEILIIR